MAKLRTVLGPVLLAAAAAGCQGAPTPEEGGGPLVIYSGRNEALIGPLFEEFEQASGVEVQVRYGDTAELAATLVEEGPHTPADVFVSQDAAALGSLARSGRFRTLPADLRSRVPAGFAAPDGSWVGLSGRARTVVYHPGRVRPEDLPQSLEEVADPRFRGRFGAAPANASFQAHMAVYRARAGSEALRRLLAGLAANDPLVYPNNAAIVNAVIAEEIEWGLVNHYYPWRALAEQPGAPVANFFMTQGTASSFINLAGAAILSDHPAAPRLLSFLLSEAAQRHFATQTFEYPLVPEVAPAVELVPLSQLPTPEVDFGEVAAVLEETLTLIKESGLLP